MVASIAAEQLAGLTGEQRAAVVGLAGADPIRQIEAIRQLAPTWRQAARDTAPRPGAPRDGQAFYYEPSAEEKLARYQDLRAKNPVLAARWADENDIFGIGRSLKSWVGKT